MGKVETYIHRHSRVLCKATLLIPIILLVAAAASSKARPWLTPEHPVYAIIVVMIVFAISWASHSFVELGVARPSFWAKSIGTSVIILLVIVCDCLFFNHELNNHAEEVAKILILAACPAILIFSRPPAK
jgi:hypothetical protein